MKKLVKKIFSLMGLNISRVKNISPVVPDEENTLKAYYQREGKRFAWLEEYNFRTIIDVGANEGQFAGKILTVFPQAEIHCFEPLHNVFEKLQSNFKGQKNVFLYNYGLGSANEQKDIFKNEYSASSSLLEMLDLHKTNFDFAVDVVPEQISIKRLDDIFAHEMARPLLIKIDVQGYEMYVLHGGTSVIMKADVVIIETSFYPLYDGQPLFEDIYNFFINAGYKYVGNVEELLAPADFKILQADAVFIKK